MSQARQKAPPSSASLTTRVLTLETRLEYVATKEDIQMLRVEFKEDIQMLRADIWKMLFASIIVTTGVVGAVAGLF